MRAMIASLGLPRRWYGRSVGVAILSTSALLSARAEAQAKGPAPAAPAAAAPAPAPAPQVPAAAAAPAAPAPAPEAPTPGPAEAAPAAPAPTPTPAPTPASVPASTASNQEAIDDFVAAQYQNDTETRSVAVKRQNRVLAERVEHVLGSFSDIGGYFRAGYGRAGRGGTLAAFGAPGAASKYRLGNEAENYGELIIGKSVYLPGAFRLNQDVRADGTPAGPIARVQIRLSMFNPYSTSATTFGLAEAWASIGNVIPSLPGAKFWAGRRFYRRHDIHVVDFFFWNMTGSGGGIEDVELGPAKLALAYIGSGSTSGLGSIPAPDPANAAGFTKSNFDLRMYDIPLLGGQTEIGLTFTSVRSGLDSNGQKAPTTNGAAVNLIHTVPDFIAKGGSNKFSFQYGTGPAKTFNGDFETIDLPEGTFIRSDQKSAWRVRVTEHFFSNLGEHFSIAPVLIFQATDQKDGTGKQYWYSAGVRPTVHFNRYFSVAADAGLDWVRDTGANTSAGVGKVTLAPQVAVANHFDSRPVIRAFVTYARWGEDFRGKVGGPDNADRLWGINGGMQMEAWW